MFIPPAGCSPAEPNPPQRYLIYAMWLAAKVVSVFAQLLICDRARRPNFSGVAVFLLRFCRLDAIEVMGGKCREPQQER